MRSGPIFAELTCSKPSSEKIRTEPLQEATAACVLLGETETEDAGRESTTAERRASKEDDWSRVWEE
jgi:hypothetical protein